MGRRQGVGARGVQDGRKRGPHARSTGEHRRGANEAGRGKQNKTTKKNARRIASLCETETGRREEGGGIKPLFVKEVWATSLPLTANKTCSAFAVPKRTQRKKRKRSPPLAEVPSRMGFCAPVLWILAAQPLLDTCSPQLCAHVLVSEAAVRLTRAARM